MVEGQDWQVWEEHGRMAFLDGSGLLDLPLPALIGAHQVANAGIALAALRALGLDEPACAAARRARRVAGAAAAAAARAAGRGGRRRAELWLDGGHNPAAGAALAEALGRLPPRPLHLVVGMLRTKDAAGFLRPLAARRPLAPRVSIPGEAATLTAGGDGGGGARPRASTTAGAGAGRGRGGRRDRRGRAGRRILICGSLYLAGRVLQRERLERRRGQTEIPHQRSVMR